MTGPRPLHPVAPVALLALALVLAPVAALPVGHPGGDAAVDEHTMGPTSDAATSLREPVASERNTTGHLALAGPIQRSRFGTTTLDVGGSVAADGGRTGSEYETAHLRQAFVAAGDNRTAQRAVVNRSADRIETRITGLESRADEALTRYNAGTISTRTYLRELAAIDAASGSLYDTIDLLAQYNSAVDEPIAPKRIAAQKARLLPLEGPVRNRVLSAMQGEDESVRVYVETSEAGVVLATIDRNGVSNQYIRESHVESAREPGDLDEFKLSENRLESVGDRFEQLYPWTWKNRRAASFGSYRGQPFLYTAGVYSVRVGHPHGTARTYDMITFIDGATQDVFREIQYKRLSGLPTTRAGTNSSQGVTLAVNRTRSGGPMLVDVTSATTGEPLDAAVIVDGERLGRTGTDGRYWTIAPRPTANVTVVRGNATVTEEVFSDGAPTG